MCQVDGGKKLGKRVMETCLYSETQNCGSVEFSQSSLPSVLSDLSSSSAGAETPPCTVTGIRTQNRGEVRGHLLNFWEDQYSQESISYRNYG